MVKQTAKEGRNGSIKGMMEGHEKWDPSGANI